MGKVIDSAITHHVRGAMNMTDYSFRDGMAALASGVSVLTTSGVAGHYGITVTSLTSVTDTPPTVLVCVNRNGIANQIFKSNRKICINILSAEQTDIGKQYASGHDNQKTFDENQWIMDKESVPPALKNAAATLQGVIASTIEYGTHSVFFVKVDEVTCADTKSGLVYFNRNFMPV